MAPGEQQQGVRSDSTWRCCWLLIFATQSHNALSSSSSGMMYSNLTSPVSADWVTHNSSANIQHHHHHHHHHHRHLLGQWADRRKAEKGEHDTDKVTGASPFVLLFSSGTGSSVLWQRLTVTPGSCMLGYEPLDTLASFFAKL